MRVGLIGYPVSHSLSAVMQNAAFAALGMDAWRYELWETPADQVPARVAAMRQPDIAGGNVTIPHKQAVMALVDKVSAHARAIGAVNTVVSAGGRLFGDNTDWRGVLADLHGHGVRVEAGMAVLVLGAGGSARGVAYALLQAGARVSLVNRSHERAAALARDFADFGAIQAVASVSDATDAALIVNCTSAGMSPNTELSPWPAGVPLPPQAVVYDLIYRPRETRLMREARMAGLRAIDGLGMLIEQGATAFEMWTGAEAARVAPIMRAALAEHLRG